MEEISSQNSDLGLEDLDKLEAKGQAENTKRATSWGIKKFEKWCDKRKLKVDFNCVTPVELNELLRKFYAEVKSEKGQPLTPSTLTGIRAVKWLWIHHSLSLYYQNSHSWYHLALFIDNNDNDMTFFGNIVYLRPCSVICGTTRAQINNIPSKSHVIPLLAVTPRVWHGDHFLQVDHFIQVL